MKKTSIFVAGLFAMATTPALADWQPETGDQFDWSIYTSDKKVGFLSISFDRDGDRLEVKREQQIKTRVLFMKVQMDQSMTSVWQGDQLISLESQTKADTPVSKEDLELKVNQTEDGQLAIIQDQGAENLVPSTVWPSTFWHKRFVDQPVMFEPGRGHVRDYKIEKVGQDQLTFSGQTWDCDKYQVDTKNEKNEDISFDLWFAADGQPCRMSFPSPMGLVDYRRD